jgi:hypothetical protein
VSFCGGEEIAVESLQLVQTAISKSSIAATLVHSNQLISLCLFVSRRCFWVHDGHRMDLAVDTKIP